MIIGSHVGFGKEQLLGSAKEAASYEANTFMFYTGAPQNTMRKDIDEELTGQAHDYMKEHGILLKNVVCHAPYIVNLANNIDLRKWEFSIQFLRQELKRCEQLGISYMVLHPGSAVSLERSVAIQNIIDALNLILEESSSCMILLETMAGKGSEIGCTLEELKQILDHVHGKVGICLDTCHLNDSGISLNDFDSYLEQFDLRIGLDKVHCIHINDSKNMIGSHKDRHENIGFGTIGFDLLHAICIHKKLKDVPKILETPYLGETPEAKERLYPPYKFEIAMLNDGTFDPELRTKIIEYYRK